MNIAEQYKELCEIAENNGIKIEENNVPEFEYKCALVKEAEDKYSVVFNTFLLSDIADKLRALKWALNCCIDETKTRWLTKDGNITNRP